MNPIQKAFPKYTAASAQVRAHGADAARYARQIRSAPTNPERLDAAVRSYNSFDHSITASQQLPLRRVWRGADSYYKGYQTAKLAAHLLIGSGAIPGARERVGRQELLAAREYFHSGVDGYRADDSRHGRYRALDWTNASIEDATNGLLMLRNKDVARPLMSGLLQTRAAIVARGRISDETVRQVDDAFDRAGSELERLIAQAELQARTATPGADAAATAPLPVGTQQAIDDAVAAAQAVDAADVPAAA